ncbi:MAG TPA: hypothetical protein PKA61_12395, partial [Nitrospira sp.]|nr:hypothetical protein [Nitrospira sp.]
MWRSAEAEPSESFQRWLDRLARPIEFATRDAGARLSMIKNLDSFVTEQVMQTLSRQSYPRAVEGSLLKLRELFGTEQGKLSPADQRRRLSEAASIVQALRAMNHRPPAAEAP